MILISLKGVPTVFVYFKLNFRLVGLWGEAKYLRQYWQLRQSSGFAVLSVQFAGCIGSMSVMA